MERNRKQQIEQEMAKLEAEIQELAEMPFDVSDPKQLGDVLFEWKNLPGGIRLESGAYDVSDEVLDKLYSMLDCRIAKLVLDWRVLAASLETSGRWAMTAEEQLEEIRQMIREGGDFETLKNDGSVRMASEVLADLEREKVFIANLDDLIETWRTKT